MSSALKPLSELGELGLLAELERRGLASGLDAEGAVLGGDLVATKDLLVEGVHFRREWTSWRDLGYKAAAVNLSDLAAMGAEPLGLLVGLGVPRDTDEAAVVELYEGLAEGGTPVVGGDVTRVDELVISITALGKSERVPGRAGAVPGDLLVVTGELGAAAAGLHALQHGLAGFDELVERHRRPPLRLEEGRRLSRSAHALVDLSDGLIADARRIADRSGCRLVIDVEAVPRAARSDEVAGLPFWALGEDYELLAALASDDARASGFPIVGHVEEGSGVEPDLPHGWDSFGA
jgi:thiamine-monophosphate kinase